MVEGCPDGYVRHMGVNVVLAARLADLGLKQDELAVQMNDAIEAVTGKPGTFSDRTVRRLLNGSTRRPAGNTKVALERVFGCSAEDLGFNPTRTTAAPPEEHVRRRRFITSAAGTAAAAATPHLTTPPARVSMSDVHRLQDQINKLTLLDDRHGGQTTLDDSRTTLVEDALTWATRALDLQQQNVAGERVRRSLYGVAADFTALAAWCCIDARDLARAQRYLDRAMTLAGMAQDHTIQLRVWNSIAMLAHQQKRFPDAVAAARAAQNLPITRKDPFFASFTHARTAIGFSNLGEGQQALRRIGYAQEALVKATPLERPSWTHFYGPAELLAMTGIVQENLKMPAASEASSHKALAALPDRFQRNRALATTRLALAQLHQGDVELGCASASRVFDIMGGDPVPGRMRTLLGDFHRDLLSLAPRSPRAYEWADELRTKWS